MEKIDLKDFRFTGSTLGEIADLRTMDAADKAGGFAGELANLRH